MVIYERCAFIWFLVSSDLRLLINERLIFSKEVKISDFRVLSGWIEKYKPPCVRLVIISLDMNADRLQFLVSEDIFFYCVFSDFWTNFLLWDVINQLRMQKSIIDSCLNKKVSDRLSSFETCWGSLLHLLNTLWRSLLHIDKASLFETFGSLKLRNFGYALICL